jgi:hypothetical protein
MDIICVPEKIKDLWKELTESRLTNVKPAKAFNLSPYWEYHKNLIQIIEFKQSTLQGYSRFQIKGDSGYYVPPKRLSTRCL